MKKPGFPVWIIIVLALLIGGLVAVSSMNNKNVEVFAAHDHDKDGKADHGEGEH